MSNGLGYCTIQKPDKYVQFSNGLVLGCLVPAKMELAGTGQSGFRMITVFLLEFFLNDRLPVTGVVGGLAKFGGSWPIGGPAKFGGRWPLGGPAKFGGRWPLGGPWYLGGSGNLGGPDLGKNIGGPKPGCWWKRGPVKSCFRQGENI